ncbi:S1C family serine protease [Noviherbaspirillum saxi]|uniref:Peptidase S1 n=1 Tax=Noviherbaspirillum saxi TaxID=2320863 RepID=A0A3A3FLD4_9BURK|nr:trypsin-like peptidase domain-containing protein [Noviherbaspirillum saxi]RJF96283.1 peptidase S1 [Noviherbaspirillum saxi]
MKKNPLYSKSTRNRRVDAAMPAAPQEADAQATGSTASPVKSTEPIAEDAPVAPRRTSGVRNFATKHERLLLVLVSVLLSSTLFYAFSHLQSAERKLTQRDIDAAVMHTLEQNILPSPEAKAFARIRPSVVRVTQVGREKNNDESNPTKALGVGTGVVVVDRGIILTNLHVVEGNNKIQIDFADGTKSDAVIVQKQPENDLAVLQASTVPDDLIPATLRSSQGLAIGDKVVAVGFPFNIGPSASSGIVSGLKRNYQSDDEERVLANLIQFDAAANPGNSGGPLITMNGEVVGIVTAILSPNPQGSFIGIGFAVPIETAAAAAGEAPF